MKIGIIVYSQTGNTHSIALKIQEALIRKGHNVDIEKIEAIRDPKQPAKDIKITKIPSVEKYDGIIFASFVEAFCLCPVMDVYLKQIKSIKNKKVAFFVTQFFPYPWMGGNHAIKQMEKTCKLEDNDMHITGVINWKNKKREEKIKELVEQFTNYFDKK